MNSSHRLRLLAIFASVLSCLPLNAAEIHLSPAGNDANKGDAASPLKSLDAARQAARKLKSAGPVTILLHAGTYYLPETLVLTAEDSGDANAPILYTSAPGEEAVISGGAKLDLKWEPHRDGIMKAAVPAGLVTDQLFVNGQRQHLARYPNFDPNVLIYNGYAADAISPERAARWADPAGGFIHMMHGSMWGGYHYRITGKDASGKLLYEGGWQNNRGGPIHREFRMVENIFEELDAPGEWFLNPKTNTLYFYPPAGVDLSKAVIEVVRLRHLVEFKGSEQSPVKFVNFKAITFRHAARTFMDNKEPILLTDWTTYRGGALFYNGAEDCALEDCFIDQVGGNAVFVNNYNRRIAIKSCHIANAGANGVAFFGDQAAVRDPRTWKETSKALAGMDRTPGPKTNNYPAQCLVDDCLIYLTGRVEKQTAGVQIDMVQDITVRHCSIYDVPRAGINIGDGCWGGHVIEYCDVFDTVKETGDHGSFNSWGRDRYWGRQGWSLEALGEKDYHAIAMLDVVKPITLHDNRWRCDHGWDVDLDDGSSNYHIYNNLFLNGGLKLREGFYRTAENNIMVHNSLHPHVWYPKSEAIVRHNILMAPYRPVRVQDWGSQVDNNFFTSDEALVHVRESDKTDANSIAGDPMFIDPEKGDYRVKESSGALKAGFKNFPMDQFGVASPKLRAIAKTPEIPGYHPGLVVKPNKRPGKHAASNLASPVAAVFQARARNITTLGERSAYGLPGEYGVLFVDVPAGSLAAKFGIEKEDVVVECNDKELRSIEKLTAVMAESAGKPLTLGVIRKQSQLKITAAGYAYAVIESQDSPEAFKLVKLDPSAAHGKISASQRTNNEPLSILLDGKLAANYGPIFSNGVTDGMYKLDLGAAVPIAQVNTYSHNYGGRRGRQHFVLYGSSASSDPGWKVDDAAQFTPIATIDSGPAKSRFIASSIRQGDGKPLGTWRWLIWAVSPAESTGAENTAYQEFQVIPGSDGH